MSQEEFKGLKAFGFMPGNYMIPRCRTCGGQYANADKRAWNCKPCASKLWGEAITDAAKHAVEWASAKKFIEQSRRYGLLTVPEMYNMLDQQAAVIAELQERLRESEPLEVNHGR